MCREISRFRKTEHFMLRQWERGITDDILLPILSEIHPNDEKILYIISKKVIKTLDKEIDQELFIKINGKILITCFYENLQAYIGIKKSQNYLIINSIKKNKKMSKKRKKMTEEDLKRIEKVKDRKKDDGFKERAKKVVETREKDLSSEKKLQKTVISKKKHPKPKVKPEIKDVPNLPSTTGNPSGKRRGNNAPSPKK